MKKIYTISVSLLFLASGLFSQGLSGFFQITVTDLPGGTTNRAVIKMRPTNASLVPQISTCDADDIPVTDLITGLNWMVKWPTSTGITSINVTGPNAQGMCPDPGSGTGYGVTFSGPVRTSPNGLIKGRGFYVPTTPCIVPVNWALNQWITICTLSITGGNCTVCEDLDIYMLGDVQQWEDTIDCTHTLSYSLLGGPGIPYDAEPFNGPLPLNLISFDAEKSGTTDAQLTWTTANEENTSHFQIQRSFDKSKWFDVGKVGAAGYSVEIRNYNFLDYQVYNGVDARLRAYYRLKMVDLDGRTSYSPIRDVVFGTDAAVSNQKFAVYPNPSTDGLNVEWDANRVDQPTALEFFDIEGKLVYSQKVSENTNQSYVDFGRTTIQPGLYLLRILNGIEPLDYKQIVVGNR